MRLTVTVVGRPRQAGLAAAIADYERRAERYWKLEVHEVREESARSSPGEVRRREAERLSDRVPSAATLVVCDERGEGWTSAAFAEWLRERRDRGVDTAFVIGGAFGVQDELRSRANVRLALAPWTLPHELARLVLTEQLYRAGTLLRGEPYHK